MENLKKGKKLIIFYISIDVSEKLKQTDNKHTTGATGRQGMLTLPRHLI